MATPGRTPEETISPLDNYLLQVLSVALGVDAAQLAKESKEDCEKEQMKMPKGFKSQMRSEEKRLKTFDTYKTYSSWTPQEMAAAGFYFTGVKSGVQCFCCGLTLFTNSIRRVPLENHEKSQPDCEFLLGKDVGNIAKYDIRVKNPEHKLRGGKARYQEDEARLESFKNWPFYAQEVSPHALSAAGFVFTGKRDSVQCFSCGGCLGNWEDGDDPWKEHAKWFPKCEYLQSKKSSEEIAEYIQSYKGFIDVTGEHFVNSWVKIELPMTSGYYNDSIFANEQLRQDTFKDWPHQYPDKILALAKAGLFYRGVKDIVQCFSCGVCLEDWKEDDDPLADHTKYSPDCLFLQNMKSFAEVIPDLPSCSELSESTEITSKSSLEVSVHSTVPEVAQTEAQWFHEAKSLNEQLRAAYVKASFRHMSFLDISHRELTDHLLQCDLSIASKHISSSEQEPLLLPEVFANLNSVMCVEGEAGSGKTVFLKKIAFLWASGCCPLLSRFQLVFYLSLSSTRLNQGLANIVCDQLLKTEGSVTELSLMNTIQQLKNQVLFLLDDYSEMCAIPQVIQKLILKNHSSRTCLLIAVRTNRARDIRRHLDTILEIKAFPFYNTIYLLRTLFSDNIIGLVEFMVFFGRNKDLQGIYKTPLFVAAVCAYWLQNPSGLSFDEMAVFKSYVKCLSLMHRSTAVSFCGELALKGYFSSRFEFSDSDLSEAGVDEDEDLVMCLMSKFTAQRLRPVYRFLNPTFQEFLAGMRLIELLDSDTQEDQDLGLYYLKKINSSFMVIGLYDRFLKCAFIHPSTKAGPKVVSHLLQLVDNKETLENIPENDYMKQHLETSLTMHLFEALWQFSPKAYFSLASKKILALALKIAYQSNTVAACSPFISQFLQGRTLSINELKAQYFFDYPESLLLLRSVHISINEPKKTPELFFSGLERCFDRSQVPTTDEDYAANFERMDEFDQNLAEKQENIKRFLNSQLRVPLLVGLSSGYWKLSPKPCKIPLLEVQVANVGSADQDMLTFLKAVFPVSQRINLHLTHSGGFLESIHPVLELNKASVTKCSISHFELSTAEQELLLTLPALESLEVSGTTQLQEQIFPNLGKFQCLKELSVKLDDKPHVFSVIPEEFPNLHHMEKLSFQILAEWDSSKLAYTLGSLKNLEELILPCGKGICQVAKLIIQQCLHLQCLRVLSFFKTLNDDSVVEIAKVAVSGGFQKLENLNLSINHEITEEGYRNFFQALDNLPNLQELSISRHFTECIKVQARTVKALSQCVLRLPSLIQLSMLSWLLDAEDITLLNAMKERHPQSKHLTILWKWVLSFPPHQK
ncbi:baculoviral IAP repeat-containing protein 1 isoform X2 [Castor canadensis]|uniref:Baculoviral IAP repeat-containing protein 1 isoform X2 n=1 Tax=Castor canadensis TaxID=51338 RepID=A0AC58MVJ8_CASCN